LFSSYKGTYTGFQSIASFFSFRSGKYISTGESSAIFCKDSLLRDTIKNIVDNLERWTLLQELKHCIATYVKSAMYHKPWYGIIGYSLGRLLDGRLNLTAKSGFKLKSVSKGDLKILNDRIKTFIAKVNKQRENSYYLLEHLKIKNAYLPREKSGYLSNYYQFAVRFSSTEQRDYMADYLMKNGIDSAKYLDDIVDKAAKNYGYQGDCPVAERCAKTTLIIPNYYNLSFKDLSHIVRTINDVM
jgi:dTDP-4-amino-4,6-dideoxygalactose transaminase